MKGESGRRGRFGRIYGMGRIRFPPQIERIGTDSERLASLSYLPLRLWVPLGFSATDSSERRNVPQRPGGETKGYSIPPRLCGDHLFN
jgi:hypothetical protein